MGKVIRSAEDLEEAYALADSVDCVLEGIYLTLRFQSSCGNGKDVTVFGSEKHPSQQYPVQDHRVSSHFRKSSSQSQSYGVRIIRTA